MTSTSALDCKIIEPQQPASASVIWLHGLGADYNDFVPIVDALQLPTDQPTRFVFPNAPVRPVTLNAHMPMRAWYDIYSLSDLEHEDEAGIHAAQQQLETLIEQEQQRGMNSERIVIAGFSQGGAIALFTGLRYDKPLAGILTLSGYLPLHHQLLNNETNHNTPILLMHGEHDDILPISYGQLTHELLQRNNYQTEWQTFPMGHEVCNEQITAIRDWLQNILHATAN